LFLKDNKDKLFDDQNINDKRWKSDSLLALEQFHAFGLMILSALWVDWLKLPME